VGTPYHQRISGTQRYRRILFFAQSPRTSRSRCRAEGHGCYRRILIALLSPPVVHPRRKAAGSLLGELLSNAANSYYAYPLSTDVYELGIEGGIVRLPPCGIRDRARLKCAAVTQAAAHRRFYDGLKFKELKLPRLEAAA